MPHPRRFVLAMACLIAAAVALVACGGSPSSPDSAAGVVLHGTVLGAPTASVAAQSARTSAAATVTVTVQENPAITATVGADGSFTLRGLPEGGFTLVFTSGGVTLGTMHFDEVKPNQEITITVRMDGNTVVLVDEHRDGIGHGDVEIEGTVGAVLVLQPAADSRFTIDGKTVVARPGETAIREGNRARAVTDLTIGRRVHVKGTWMPPDASGQAVLAQEIMLQGTSDDVTGPPPDKACMISGGTVGAGIELEGSVVSGSSAAFLMKVQGNRSSGNVQVDASGASFKCNGSKGTDAQCRASVAGGAKVHVSGTLQSCDALAALARASQVMVQK